MLNSLINESSLDKVNLKKDSFIKYWLIINVT
jgi:hypothetical protein